MSNFEWQQEDEDWDEQQSSPSPESSNSRRPLLIGVVIVMALAAAGLIIYWQVDEQLKKTETAVQANILASHKLVQTAVATEDTELLFSVLSGRIPSWTEAQQAALASNVMIDRRPWGLKLVAPKQETIPQLTLAPDLREAELLFSLEYQLLSTTGVTETVVLSQTAVYRQGTRSWLLSPPDSAFWGDWQTKKGERLTLIYPERDQALAEKLAVDLEQILQQICTDPSLPDCVEDAAYTMRLDTHPDSLVNAVKLRDLLDGEPYLTLPAPTLFGLPTDDTAYEAVVQAYGVPLATAVFADLFGWECCHHAVIFQALVEYQLSQMGIMAWPITTADHVRALRDGYSFLNVGDNWRNYASDETDTPNLFLYTAFDFIFRHYPDFSPSYILGNIRERGDLAYWLSNGLNQTGYQVGTLSDLWQTLQSEWWQFAYTETLLIQEKEELPIPLPAQDIALACLSGDRFDRDTTMSLYQFSREKDSWQELLSSNSFILFNSFLDDNGLVIQSLDLDETNQWQTQIWAFEGQQTELRNDEGMFFSLGQFEPTGRYAVTFVGEDESAIPQPTLIDLNSCTETDCDLIPLPGMPHWSPDGERTLIGNKNIFEGGVAFWRNGRMVLFDATQPPVPTQFWLGNALGQLPLEKVEAAVIDNGYSPFWLDNDTYGYVYQNPETGDAEVVVQSVDGEELETVVTLADIQAEASDDALALATIHYVITHPAQPNKLFVVALDALGQEAYVFMVDRDTGELDLRIQSYVQLYHSLGFSPNGRWLVLMGYQGDTNGQTTLFLVHDLENDETQTYTSSVDGLMLSPLYDWSADGNWLLFLMNGRVMNMVAPAYNYQLVQLHDQGYCTSMAWINR